jgi:hypothetical protein
MKQAMKLYNARELVITGDRLEKEYRIPTVRVNNDENDKIFCFSEPHIFFNINIVKGKIYRVNLDTKQIEESPDNLSKENSSKITVMKCPSNDIRFIFIGYSNGQVDIFCSSTLYKLFSA